MAVNVSARQLDHAGFSDLAIAGLRDKSLPGGALIVEITESSLKATSTGSTDQLRQLRAHGVRVAMDDFGTGYSSLAAISRLPLDIVKIDKSFVQAPTASDTIDPRGSGRD